MRELAPLAFEVVLHYASALVGGGYAMVLRHARAGGLPVEELAGADTPVIVRQAIEHLAAGRYAVLQSRMHEATMQCEAPSGHEHFESFAVLDAAVGGEHWFVASRLVWPSDSFSDTACARAHDQIVVVVDQGDPGARVVRLRFDDAQAVVMRKLVRDALLRDLVFRPAFGVADTPPTFSESLTRKGDGDGTASP